MKAEDVRLTELLEGPKQFIVPVFQRDYSWGTKHCLQLWNDIVRVGSDENAKAHFVGSIVYIAAEETSAKLLGGCSSTASNAWHPDDSTYGVTEPDANRRRQYPTDSGRRCAADEAPN